MFIAGLIYLGEQVNHEKQKMRYMILGAVIMLVGMILGAARRMTVKARPNTSLVAKLLEGA